jgi:hypothetical protein
LVASTSGNSHLLEAGLYWHPKSTFYHPDINVMHLSVILFLAYFPCFENMKVGL